MADNVIEFLIKGDASDADKAFGSFDDVLGKLGKGLTILGAAMAAVEFVEFIGKQIEVADQMGKMALKSGVAVEAFSQMAQAFALSDVSAEELASGFKFLNKSIDEAKQGNDAAILSFNSIGISMANLKNDSADEVMLKLADAFTKIEDPAARNTMLLEKFGRAGLKLAPAMEEGRAGIEKLMRQADKLGLTVDKEFAAAADNFGDSMQTVRAAADGAGRQLGKALLPILQETIDALFNFGGTADESILPWGKITVGIVGAVAAVLLSLVTIVTSVTQQISASFRAAGTMIGASMASIEQALEGNFSAALDTLGQGWQDAGDIQAKTFDNINNDLLKTGAAINKMDEYVQNYGQSIKAAGAETEAASKMKKLDFLSKDAATQLETARKALSAFIGDMDKAEVAASGNRLALIDAEYNANVSKINDFAKTKEQKSAALMALDAKYAADRVALNDQMLAQLGVGDETYRARQEELTIAEGERMQTAGISKIQADAFVAASLLEQQAAYFEAKNAALSEDYLTQDEITIARDEAEQLRLETNLANKLITEDQFNAAMYQREVAKEAALGSFRAQAAASQLAFDKMTQDQRLGVYSDAFGKTSQLMQSSNKKQFAIGKAAAMAQAVINTYQAVLSGYATAPFFPVGMLMGTTALAMGMMNMSKIASAQPPQAHAGLTNVPSEGTFLLSKGERVIQPEQNKDLTSFLNGRTDSGNRNDTTDRASAPTIVLRGEGAPSDAYIRDKLLPALHSAYGDGARAVPGR